jgi:hypothetical protein
MTTSTVNADLQDRLRESVARARSIKAESRWLVDSSRATRAAAFKLRLASTAAKARRGNT